MGPSSVLRSQVLICRHIKPWTESYELEYGSAVTQGSTGEDKLKHALPEKFGEGLSVIFENGVRCRVIK